METFSDASFKRESEEGNGVPTGKANRGAVLLRTGRPLNEARLSGERTAMVHLLDWYSGSLKRVTRSTFTSEGLACIAATHQAIDLSIVLHEINVGPTGAKDVDAMIREASLTYSNDVYVDAMSLIKALEAAVIKAPQENRS